MKLQLLFLSIFLFLFLNSSNAQNLQGIATYKTDRNVELKMDSTSMGGEMQKQIAAQLRKQFQKEYTLDFTKDESIYKEVPKLDAPSAASAGGFQIQVSGGADILYKNIKESRFINQNELFSKQFLIKDSLKFPEWELKNETKMIGQYVCFKASYTRTDTIKTSIFSSEEGKDSEKDKEEIRETVVTAWYTPQLPVQNGPDRYDGLPGLIMEVNDGKLTILCSKIILNPEDGVDVEEPTKGKEVTQDEFDKIMRKKLDDMNENRRSSRKGESNFEIRIGG